MQHQTLDISVEMDHYSLTTPGRNLSSNARRAVASLSLAVMTRSSNGPRCDLLPRSIVRYLYSCGVVDERKAMQQQNTLGLSNTTYTNWPPTLLQYLVSSITQCIDLSPFLPAASFVTSPRDCRHTQNRNEHTTGRRPCRIY